ncbi:DUF222 domain-containing protein [Glaciibacter sp. 2TAF33]|uniref:HNH endonuclease signature motif containing protein n=1 Tax=Glaciibacter sp. 2TAF33 TaxID=3233015 RepID=UPI003F920E5B
MTTTVEAAPPGTGNTPGTPAASTLALLESAEAFATEWAGALPAFGRAQDTHDPARDAARMGENGLIRVLQAGFALKRHLDALLTAGAGQLAYLSRPELGAESLAKKNGWGTAPALTAELGRITTAEAARLCRVGEATRHRNTLQGEPLPALWPAVAAAVHAGDLGVDSALHIISSLGQASPRAERAAVDAAEQALVQFGTENPADSVRKLAILCRDRLDTDGIEPREQELINDRSVRYSTRANGMERLEVLLDPLSMSYVRAGLEGLVADTLRKVRFEHTPTTPQHDAPHHDRGDGCGDGCGDGRGDDCGDGCGDDCGDGKHDHCGDSCGDDCGDDCGDGCDENHEVLPDHDTDGRSIEQIRADHLVETFKHVLGCENAFPALAHTTIVVRLDYDTLINDLAAAGIPATAQIDGTEQPISAGTARKLAADADIIPLVLGGDSEVLDLGRARRLFTRAQKLALIDRDGGCAWCNCNKPPGYTEVHHLKWWKKHAGTTNLSNGVLLCSPHHHLLHSEGWDIKIIDNIPWFIPPASIDITRTPRRGGRIQ